MTPKRPTDPVLSLVGADTSAIGAWLIQHVRVETFRRICMSFDAWIVGFGVSALPRELQIVEGAAAYLALVSVMVIDGWLLCRFFRYAETHVIRPIAA